MCVAHVAFNFSFRGQRGHGVDDDHVNGVGAHQHVGDFQCLLARIGLGNQQVIYVYTQLARILRVKRVLGVNEGTGCTRFLRLCNHRQRQGGFTRGLWTVDFNNTAFWQTANAQRDVQTQRTCRDSRDWLAILIAHQHDGAFAELTFDLTQGRSQGFLLVVVH